MAIRDMESLLLKVKNKKVLPLIDEAMRCYNASAYRASISIAFNAMFYDLFDKLESLKETNPTIKKLYIDIDKKKSKQEVYESFLIDNLASNGLITKLEKDILDGMKVMRNKSSHPTEHEPTAEEARYVFSTVIDLVLSKGKILSRSAADDILTSLKENNYFPSKIDLKENLLIVKNDVEYIHESILNYLVTNIFEKITDAPEEQNYVIFLVSLLSLKKSSVFDSVKTQLDKSKYIKHELKWLVIALAIHHPNVFGDDYASRIVSMICMDYENNNYGLKDIRSWRMAMISLSESKPLIYGKIPAKTKRSAFMRHSTWDICLSKGSELLRKDFIAYFMLYLSSSSKITTARSTNIQNRVDYIQTNDVLFSSILDESILTTIFLSFLQTTLAKLDADVEVNPADDFVKNIGKLIPKTYGVVMSFRAKDHDAFAKEAERLKVTSLLHLCS